MARPPTRPPPGATGTRPGPLGPTGRPGQALKTPRLLEGGFGLLQSDNVSRQPQDPGEDAPQRRDVDGHEPHVRPWPQVFPNALPPPTPAGGNPGVRGPGAAA